MLKRKSHRLLQVIRDYAGEIPGIMNAFYVIFIALCATTLAAEEACYDDVVRACKTTNKLSTSPIKCSAKYGAIEADQEELQRYVNLHFTRSFEYLLMGTHYLNYETNRPGFAKLFRDLSDQTWEEAIDLIKYITTRGGDMNFNMISQDLRAEELVEQNFELYELNSVAKALDIEKKLAAESFQIHWDVTRKNNKFYDPEISYHLEGEFMPKHRDIIRKLTGYTSDLSSLLDGPDSSLALYLFDEYLQKQ